MKKKKKKKLSDSFMKREREREPFTAGVQVENNLARFRLTRG